MLSALPLGHTALAPGQLIQEFSRASIGTYFDVGGVLRTAPINGQRMEAAGLLIENAATNLFPDSNQLETSAWNKRDGLTVIGNSGTSPDGFNTAEFGTWTSGDGYIWRSVPPVQASTAYTLSVWAKKGSGTPVLSLHGWDNVGEFIQIPQTLGTSWTRYSYSFTTHPGAFPLGNDFGVKVTGGSFFVYGLQLELGSVPSSYIPTPTVFVSRASTATYFDSAGTLQTAGVNVQRFGYDPATHAGPFPILEDASSNQFPVSSGTSCFSILTNVTAAASAAIAPDGSSTVVTVNRSAVVADDRAQRNLTVANDSSPYVFSIYVLKGPSQLVGVHAQVVGGTGVSNVLTFDRSTGVISGGVGDVQDCGAFWRVSSKVVNNNSGNTTFAAQFRPNTAGIGSADCWGAQVEVGSVATSYIPTTTVAVTRAADVTTSVIASRAADFGYLFTPETTPTIAAIGKQSSMKYRALSASGDYVFGSGSVWLVDSPQAVAQAVRTRLQLLVGDWFLDQKAGLDKSLILGVGTAQTRDRVIQQRILETPGVKSLVSYASHVDGRKFSVTATIDTIYGATNITEIL